MIHMVQPLHIGNALRLHLTPPLGARVWRILRNETGVFAGPSDPSAFVAYQGSDHVVVDATMLRNGVQQFYQPFWTTDGVNWLAEPVASGTPNANYQEKTEDVLTLLRERLEAGLLVECERGNFQPEGGYIRVVIGSPALDQELRLPLVTLHMEHDGSGERGIGEAVGTDQFDAIGFDWEESEGWLSNTTVTMIGWSLNGDERNELRKALRRLVIANLEVFESFGWARIDFGAEDIDLVNGEMPSPIYQVSCSFTCLAPVVVSGVVPAVREITVRRN